MNTQNILISALALSISFSSAGFGFPSAYANSDKTDDIQLIATYGNGYLETVNGLPVLHVKGSYHEMGVQYGYLVADKLQTADNILFSIAAQTPPVSSFPTALLKWAQNTVGWIFWNHFSENDKAIMNGIVEGAAKSPIHYKITNYDLAFLNSLIDIAGIFRAQKDWPSEFTLRLLGLSWLKANCDSFAAWGSRTVGGKTFQTRNTDVQTGMGLEKIPLVVIYKPDGRIPYMSAGFSGQTGAFTGLNAYGVGLGQIWAFSDRKAIATPWQLQMAEVLSRATTAPDAVSIFQSLDNRTYGNNFIFADAKGNGRAVETTPIDFAVFTANDPNEDQAVWQGQLYDIRMPDAVFRADAAMDAKIRSYQTASNGPTGDPRTAAAYINRYKGQADRILAYQNAGELIGEPEAEAISRGTAMIGESLQASVYANTDREGWFSYATMAVDGTVSQAYQNEYKHVSLAANLPTLSVLNEHDGQDHLLVQSWMQGSRSVDLELRVLKSDDHSTNPGVIGSQNFALTSDMTDLGPLQTLGVQSGNVIELRHAGTGDLADRLVIQ